MADPMHQFKIVKLLELPTIPLPGGGVIDLSLTNSTVAMMTAALLVILLFATVTLSPKVIPGRFQLVGEGLFKFIDDLAVGIIGYEGRAFFPFVFTIFTFVLFMNLQGMLLMFTATSQLAVTVTLALMTILLVIVVGLARNGLGFFKLFLPSGVPWYLWWLVVPIEVISFLLRPVTLSLRLFGNMLGGHVALKVFAGFVISLAGLASSGGLGLLGIPGAMLSMGGVIALTALEFLVAFLQAFVFAVLACVYLNDAVHAGHH